MESHNKNDESRPGATLLGVVGHQETVAGGGSPQVSKSVTTNNAQMNTETGNIGDNGIVIVYSENDPKVVSNINPITMSNQSSKGSIKRVINIGVFNEA